MTIVRQVPRILQPKQAEDTTVPSKASASLETARVENVRPGICPICNMTMTGAKTNDLDVLVCLDHNIVMPTQDR